MKKIVFSVYLVTFVFMLFASQQESVVKGRIYDRSSGQSLQGANVIFKSNMGVFTREDGSYLIKTSPGEITLTIKHIGFKSESKTIFLKANDTTFIDFDLTTEISEIDQVVISADRLEQRISELSVSMNLIKPGQLNQNHISDPKELINKTSGIEIMDGQASVRGGSGFSYGAGSRVLALVDGLPVMAADAGNIKWSFLPLENLSQIEIIKGASSVIYGSSALNGVINFRTADATKKPQTKFYLESGIYGSPRNPDWKWWDSPRLFYNASFSHLQKFGNTDLSVGLNLLEDNGYRYLNANRQGKVNMKLKKYSQKVNGLTYGVALNGGKTLKTDFVIWENGWNGALKQDKSTAIELHGDFFSVDPFLSFKSGKKSVHDLRARLQSSQNKFPESDQNNSRATNFYSEYLFLYKFSQKLSLNSGLSQNVLRINSNFYGNHQGLNSGIFSQVDFTVSQRLKLSSGIRFEQNWLDGVYDKLIPLFRAGVNFRAMDYTFLRVSFGQGYRFPSIAEKYASTTLGSVKIFPSLFIQPEEGWNAEIGLKQGILTTFFGGLLDLSLFYSENRDMIEFVFGRYPDPGKDTYSLGFKATNIEASRVYGGEIQLSLSKATGKFNHNLNGGYVFMYPVEFNTNTGKNTGVMLKFRRKHSATINYTVSAGKTDFGISVFVKSKILNIDDVFLNPLTRESLLPGFFDYWITKNKGYVLADLNLGYTITKQFKISAMIKNITNAEYMGRPGDIQPQRNFSLRINGSF